LLKQEEGQSGDELRILFGGMGPHSDLDCLFLFHCVLRQAEREFAMIYDSDRMPEILVAELLKASAITGFTLAEIEALVNSELETQYLLEYITAIICRRINESFGILTQPLRA
jgi:hypothetical protein